MIHLLWKNIPSYVTPITSIYNFYMNNRIVMSCISNNTFISNNLAQIIIIKFNALWIYIIYKDLIKTVLHVYNYMYLTFLCYNKKFCIMCNPWRKYINCCGNINISYEFQCAHDTSFCLNSTKPNGLKVCVIKNREWRKIV